MALHSASLNDSQRSSFSYSLFGAENGCVSSSWRSHSTAAVPSASHDNTNHYLNFDDNVLREYSLDAMTQQATTNVATAAALQRAFRLGNAIESSDAAAAAAAAATAAASASGVNANSQTKTTITPPSVFVAQLRHPSVQQPQLTFSHEQHTPSQCETPRTGLSPGITPGLTPGLTSRRLTPQIQSESGGNSSPQHKSQQQQPSIDDDDVDRCLSPQLMSVSISGPNLSVKQEEDLSPLESVTTMPASVQLNRIASSASPRAAAAAAAPSPALSAAMSPSLSPALVASSPLDSRLNSDSNSIAVAMQDSARSSESSSHLRISDARRYSDAARRYSDASMGRRDSPSNRAASAAGASGANLTSLAARRRDSSINQSSSSASASASASAVEQQLSSSNSNPNSMSQSISISNASPLDVSDLTPIPMPRPVVSPSLSSPLADQAVTVVDISCPPLLDQRLKTNSVDTEMALSPSPF